MRRSHAFALASGLAALAAIVPIAARERTAQGGGASRAIAPIEGSPVRPISLVATSSAASGAAPDRRAPSPAASPPQRSPAAGEPVEGERWLLSALLANALRAPLAHADRLRLADLLLEARDLRSREAPAREREILLSLNTDFERIAGEPMGNVASRLAFPDELPARAPDPLAEPHWRGADPGVAP